LRRLKAHAKQEFDALVVASGHYHSPRVPDIPGLKEWKQRWPSRVQHSKNYRDPEEYRNQVGPLPRRLHLSACLTDNAVERPPYWRWRFLHRHRTRAPRRRLAHLPILPGRRLRPTRRPSPRQRAARRRGRLSQHHHPRI
jgi:hypothetical protein